MNQNVDTMHSAIIERPAFGLLILNAFNYLIRPADQQDKIQWLVNMPLHQLILVGNHE